MCVYGFLSFGVLFCLMCLEMLGYYYEMDFFFDLVYCFRFGRGRGRVLGFGR